MRCCVPLRTSWDSHTFDLCLRWHILLVPSQISPRLDLLLHFVFDGSGAKLQLNATGGHDCCSETVTIWIVGNEGVHQLRHLHPHSAGPSGSIHGDAFGCSSWCPFTHPWFNQQVAFRFQGQVGHGFQHVLCSLSQWRANSLLTCHFVLR